MQMIGDNELLHHWILMKHL